jgi:hypothetical protein
MAATKQSTVLPPSKSTSGDRDGGAGWVLPSGRRLIDFVIAGGLAAPVLALVLRHVVQVERQRKKAQLV